jgi:hypothetical protein
MTGSRRLSRQVIRMLALAAGVAATVIAVAGTSAAAGGPSATLSANKHMDGLPAVVYGSSITLSGQVSLSGSSSYAVQAEAWPFTGGFTTITSGKTTGSYSFVVSPSHATRYRVVTANGPTSPVLTVYVVDRELSFSCNLCNNSNGAGAHTLTVKERFRRPPGPVAPGHAYFYYALNPSSDTPTTLSRVATASRHFTGSTYGLTVSYTVNFPNVPHFAFAEKFCVTHDEPRDGVGLPGRHGCGNAKIDRLRYTG